MKSSKRHWVGAVAITLAVFSVVFLGSLAPARADSTATSTITQMQILESSDTQYELYHGVLWLEYDKAKHNYRWGGKHCEDKGLSDANLSFLFTAFRAQHKVTIRYKRTRHEGAFYRCITGFIIARN
ncbi:MAG: hypothetical protein MJE77_18865 [Proteobacteria bacterium]|nr:hypothetical protein [Pseudomonadota bacterium]